MSMNSTRWRINLTLDDASFARRNQNVSISSLFFSYIPKNFNRNFILNTYKSCVCCNNFSSSLCDFSIHNIELCNISVNHHYRFFMLYSLNLTLYYELQQELRDKLSILFMALGKVVE